MFLVYRNVTVECVLPEDLLSRAWTVVPVVCGLHAGEPCDGLADRRFTLVDHKE